MRKGNVLKGLVLLVGLFFLSVPSVLAQHYHCQCDFDCDGYIFPSDLMVFLALYSFTGCTSCPAPVPAAVQKTGQTASYATGDDGQYKMGKGLLSGPRFSDNGDGTVTDYITGLIWLKDANCFGARTWAEALSDSNGLASGSCGLSSAGDWRLPNRMELESLLCLGFSDPAIPNTAGIGQWVEGDPFTDVQSSHYWSSTTLDADTDLAWGVSMHSGLVNGNAKNGDRYVWPIKGSSEIAPW